MTADIESEDDDTATSSAWDCGDSDYVQHDLPCHSIPQEPGSIHIGNLNAARTCVKHTAAERRLLHVAGVDITASLRTDVYTGRGPTANDGLDWYVRDIANKAVARFVSRRRPRIPSFTDAIQAVSA